MLFSLEKEAFILAETLEEFPILVRLSLKNQDRNSKLEGYISRFKTEFSYVLYQTLLDNGELKELLEQDSVNSTYLQEFLRSNQLLHLSWIQDFSHGRFSDSFQTLWQLAEKSRGVKEQKVGILF